MTMATLLIRLAGPMQSWGGESKYNKRHTWRVPSKSAVIGLAAAALGRRRDDDISDLAALRFGCRTDREGKLLRDFQTTFNGEKATNVIEKYYLSDAVFLVGLEGDEELLREIDAAIKRPAFPLFLGRRSCPPVGRVTLGLRECQLETALASEPCLVPAAGETVKLRIAAETPDMAKNAYFLRDIPVSFDPSHRMFGFRRVHEYTAECPAAAEEIRGEASTFHDPMKELEVL